MNKVKGLRGLALATIVALLLSGCGAEATPTPVPPAPTDTVAPTAAPTDTTAPVAQPTNTTAAAAPTNTTATVATSGTTGTPATTNVVQTGINTQTFVRNFNPFSSGLLNPTLAGIYEPMMIYNQIKGELVPWLADKYEFSADNKTLTFTLHPGVKWSDGQPFTAKDVVFTFNLFKTTTGLQGPGVQVMGTTGHIDSIVAQGDNTVVFTFSQSNTPSLYDIIKQNIVPEHIWKDISDVAKYTNDNPVGTGPFTQVTMFQAQSYQVDKNPNYWQPGKPYVNGIRVSAYPGNEPQVVAATQGKVDWSGVFVPNVQQALLSKDPANFHYWTPAGGHTVLLQLNTTVKPLDDPVVRKAFSMALDRERMVTVALSGYSKPADVTGLGDSSWKVADPAKLGDWTTYNPDKANKMLDDAGYKKGADGIRVAPDGKRMSFELLMVNGFSDWVSAGQIMIPNLKAVGIELVPKPVDPPGYFAAEYPGNWQVSMYFGYPNATPYGFYRSVMSKDTFVPIGTVTTANFARYVSPKADDLLAQFAATSDLSKQKEIANQLQQTFADEAPVIPMWPSAVIEFYSTRNFTGFPSQDNPYCYGFPIGASYPEQLLIMTTIKPK